MRKLTTGRTASGRMTEYSEIIQFGHRNISAKADGRVSSNSRWDAMAVREGQSERIRRIGRTAGSNLNSLPIMVDIRAFKIVLARVLAVNTGASLLPAVS